MAITVDVVPDLSRFRTATVEEIIAETGCSEQVAEALLERFNVLPK